MTSVNVAGAPAARSFSTPTSSVDVAVTFATTSMVRFQVVILRVPPFSAFTYTDYALTASV